MNGLALNGVLLILVVMAPVVAQPAPTAPVHDVRNLHPALTWSPEQYRQWQEAGLKAAKNGTKRDKLAKKWQQDAKWPGGRQGRASARVWCLGLDGGLVTIGTFDAERLYQKANLPESGYVHTLTFEVSIISTPKIGVSSGEAFLGGLTGTTPQSRVRRQAVAGEVRALRFFVETDTGDRFPVETESRSDESGTVTYGGVATFRAQDRLNATGNGTATVVGPGGSAYAQGSWNASGTFSRTEYVPYSNATPYYKAHYRVLFPLFDALGKPIVGPNVKELTLRFVTEESEATVKYKLVTPKK